MKIRNGDELVDADYVKHLTTLTGSPGMGQPNIDIDLYRLRDGTLVAARTLADDARHTPEIDPSWPH